MGWDGVTPPGLCSRTDRQHEGTTALRACSTPRPASRTTLHHRLRVAVKPQHYAREAVDEGPTTAQTTGGWGEFEDVLVEQRNGVVVATLNRPDKLNALSGAMRVSLRRLIRELPDRRVCNSSRPGGAGRQSALDDLFFAQPSHLFPGIPQLEQHLFGVLS